MTTADPHQAVPIEPPPSEAFGGALSPRSTRTRSARPAGAIARVRAG